MPRTRALHKRPAVEYSTLVHDMIRLGVPVKLASKLEPAFREYVAASYPDAPLREKPVRTPEDLRPWVAQYAAETREHFLVVMLNTRHQVLKVELVSIGSLNASICHPREIFRPAILASAASVIFVHNHPSGDPAPSEDDLEITSRLSRVGELVGIAVLDHVILGGENLFSFREAGLI